MMRELPQGRTDTTDCDLLSEPVRPALVRVAGEIWAGTEWMQEKPWLCLTIPFAPRTWRGMLGSAVPTVLWSDPGGRQREPSKVGTTIKDSRGTVWLLAVWPETGEPMWRCATGWSSWDEAIAHPVRVLDSGD